MHKLTGIFVLLSCMFLVAPAGAEGVFPCEFDRVEFGTLGEVKKTQNGYEITLENEVDGYVLDITVDSTSYPEIAALMKDKERSTMEENSAILFDNNAICGFMLISEDDFSLGGIRKNRGRLILDVCVDESDNCFTLRISPENELFEEAEKKLSAIKGTLHIAFRRSNYEVISFYEKTDDDQRYEGYDDQPAAAPGITALFEDITMTEQYFATDRSGKPVNGMVLRNKDGKKMREYFFAHGVLTKTISYSPEGHVTWVTPYVNGSRDGEVVGYYPSGALQWRIPFSVGMAEGIRYEFFESGEVKSIAAQKADKQHGKYYELYKDGSVRFEENYKNGKKVGKRLEFAPGVARLSK